MLKEKNLKNNFKKGIFDSSETELVSSMKTPAFWKDFYEMYTKLFNNPTYKRFNKSKLTDKVSEADFKRMAYARAKETDSFIISKYMCMKMIDVMMSNPQKVDSFATDIFLYGASNTNQSSYFIKIYE